MQKSISVVIPAKNEAVGLAQILPKIVNQYPDVELIVVNDGSTDSTAEVVRNTPGAICVDHPVSVGNGGSIKSGARRASGDIIVFMDADGQHMPEDIPRLLAEMDKGFDMVVGARSHESQASLLRSVANKIYNSLASAMTGFQILDLTSGFRAVRRTKFIPILYLLPNKFSYPTTSTMAFFRSGYFVSYIPIKALQREGKSHIRLFSDGLRFLVIIMKIGTLYSPMRLFLPVSGLLFLIATLYYLFTFFTEGRFTNMGVLLYISSLLVFMLGVVSEQVSTLHYRDTSAVDRRSK